MYSMKPKLETLKRRHHNFDTTLLEEEIPQLASLVKLTEAALKSSEMTETSDTELIGLLIEYSQSLEEKLRLIRKIGAIASVKDINVAPFEAVTNEIAEITQRIKTLEKDINLQDPYFSMRVIETIKESPIIDSSLN